MINLNLENNKGYIYKQIYKIIKTYILNGELKAREKLPSKRQLARQEGVSLNTVSNAYDQLVAEGYIYSKERQGFFIEEIAPFKHHVQSRSYFPRYLREKEDSTHGWISLSHNRLDLTEFPYENWFNHQRSVFEHNLADLEAIPQLQGPLKVRKTIARMLLFNRGVKCEAEQIVLGAGTQLLLKQLMDLFPEKKVVGLETPGYPRFNQLFKGMKHSITSIELDQKGASIDSIKKINPDILVITPSHQFPTGIIMPVSRRIDILNWALQSKKRYIIEDDYDSEFKYETDNIPSLQSLDNHQSVIYMGTFSKTLFSGIRISYMVLPVELLKKYRAVHSDLMCSSNTLELYTLSRFIEQGDYMSYVKKMTYKYNIKRKTLMQELSKVFGDQIEIHSIPAGMHFIIDINTNISYEEFSQRANEFKLELSTLSYFKQSDIQQDGKISVIIGYAHIELYQIEEAVLRLKAIIN